MQLMAVDEFLRLFPIRCFSLASMFEAASRREFDVLLFWSLDRLSREGTVETLNHLQRLTSYGVHWRSFTEQYLDSTGIFREAVIGILAVVAKRPRKSQQFDGRWKLSA